MPDAFAILLCLGLGLGIIAIVSGEAFPPCTFESCPQCLLDIKENPVNLSLTGPDQNAYSTAFRVGRAPAYWESQSITAQIAGILLKEKLGFNVEYVPCEDETQCTFGTSGCSGYLDYDCTPVRTVAQAEAAVAAGRKLYPDPLSDIYMFSESYTSSLMPEAYEGTETDYDSLPAVMLGPTGYTSWDGLYIFPDLRDAAWSKYSVDVEAFRSFARREIRQLASSPQELLDGGVQAEFRHCSAPNNPTIQSSMQYHLDLNWTCNDQFWWLNPACAEFGENWSTECLVVIKDDWGYTKDTFYEYLAVSEVPVAKLMVGYDPWWELIYYKMYNMVFTWWRPAAGVQNQRGRRTNLPYDADMPPSITLKVGYQAAMRADSRIDTFLSTISIHEDYVLELMTTISDAYDAGYEDGDYADSFYQKIACDWLREHEDLYEVWIPSAKSCYQGEFFNETTSACDDCPIGKAGALSSDNIMYCVDCPVGRYSEAKGLTACVPCGSGSFVEETGQTSCELCAAGTYSREAGQSRCTVCEPGSLTPRTTESKGSSSPSECMCPEGYFDEPTEGGCVACPEGMTCSFGSSLDALTAVIQNATDANELVYPTVDEGYYTLASNPLSVYLCDESADYLECPGGSPQTCGLGHIGLMCSVCPEGTAMSSDGACVTCDSPITWIVAAALPAALLVITLSLFLLANDPITWDMTTALFACLLFSIVVTTFQSVALLTGLRIAWKAQGQVFGSFRLLLGSPSGLRVECTLTSSAAASFLFRCSLPVVCALSVAFVYLAARIAAYLTPTARAFTGVEAQNTLGQVLHTVFICIAVLVVQPLRCYYHPNGKSSMSAYPQVLCWESTEHIVIVIAGVLLGTLFLIPFMAACVWSMLRAPKMGSVDHLMRWRFLVYRFRPEKWWWGIIFLIRQVLFAFSSCIPAEQSLMQITYFAVVGLTYVAVTCTQWPWKSSLLNFFDAASVFMLAVISISASAFTDGASETEKTFFMYFHLVMFSLFVFAVLAAFAAMAMIMVKNKRWICDFKTPFSVTNRHQLIQELWIDFIENSAKLPPVMVKDAIETFTEYDLLLLLKCMSAFGSVCTELGPIPSLLLRLCTTSHPRVDVGHLDTEVSCRLRDEGIRSRAISEQPTFGMCDGEEKEDDSDPSNFHDEIVTVDNFVTA